jgi:hypothetical protein
VEKIERFCNRFTGGAMTAPLFLWHSGAAITGAWSLDQSSVSWKHLIED